jgi:hypothetical protein
MVYHEQNAVERYMVEFAVFLDERIGYRAHTGSAYLIVEFVVIRQEVSTPSDE